MTSQAGSKILINVKGAFANSPAISSSIGSPWSPAGEIVPEGLPGSAGLRGWPGSGRNGGLLFFSLSFELSGAGRFSV